MLADFSKIENRAKLISPREYKKKETILVIENERKIQEYIQEILSLEEFSTIIVENGKIGLQLAREKVPDLIICGRNTSELDGFGVLARLRQEIATATIPLIFLIEETEAKEWRKVMEMGADDCLILPFTAHQLKGAIAARLQKKAAFEQRLNQELELLRNSILLSLPHELRTALTGILACSEFLVSELETLEKPTIRTMLSCIQSSGKRLFRLVQNFLFYAELAQIATNPEQLQGLDFSQTESAMSVIKNAAVKKAKQAKRQEDLQLTLENASLKIEENYLTKLVEELVDNACKFSKPGTPIQIDSKVEKELFILTINDRGRGMTAQQISRIGAHMQFERHQYEQQGSGLGLAIAQRLVKLHRGELIVESIPDLGTTIKALLPQLNLNDESSHL